MKPTEILRAEHEVILGVLDCLEMLGMSFDGQSAESIEEARGILSFLKTFADTCHHGKEEEGLFKWMESRGFSLRQGPTAVMRAEHEQGREWIRQMNAALERKDADARTFQKAASAYVHLLRLHIDKENHCLFPMADQAVTADDEAEILKDFAQTEESKELQGQHERWIAFAARLSQKYGLKNVEKAAGCCGHGA